MGPHSPWLRTGSAPLTFLTLAGFLLAACASEDPAATSAPVSYDAAVSQWMDDTESNLVNAWGIPSKSHPMETGGRIVEYTRTVAGKTVCTTRFTIDGNGLIRRTWFTGSDCRAPNGN